MRKLFAVSSLFALFVASPLFAADGAQIFQSKGCVACHDATQDRVAQGLGPSLKMIAEAYKGKEDALVSFLKGEGKPRVYPDKYPIMQGQLALIKGLSGDERKALAAYLLNP